MLILSVIEHDSHHYWYQGIFLLCLLWILSHCFGGDGMMLLPAVCPFACKTFWMYLMWSSCLHLESPYSVNTVLATLTRSSVARLSTILQKWTCCNSLPCTELFHSWQKLSAPTTSTACMEPHMVSSSLVVVSAGIQCMWHTAFWCFKYLLSYLPNTLTSWLKVLSFWYPYVNYATAPVFVSATGKV